jgi:hypothetical protein
VTLFGSVTCHVAHLWFDSQGSISLGTENFQGHLVGDHTKHSNLRYHISGCDCLPALGHAGVVGGQKMCAIVDAVSAHVSPPDLWFWTVSKVPLYSAAAACC